MSGAGGPTAYTTGVNTIMRNIGSAVGAQVAGTIIAGNVLASGLPSDDGFTIAFLIGAVGAVVAAISILFIPSAKRAEEPAYAAA